MMISKLRITLCQMAVIDDKQANIKKAVTLIGEAAQRGSQFVVLPECFNCPYGTRHFESHSEVLQDGSPTYDAISSAARENHVWVCAGSVPERGKSGRLYNTNVTFSADGKMAGKFRKMHLYSIDTPEIKIDESEVLSPGSQANSVVISDDIKFGVIICYDLRFPQLGMRYAQEGTSFIVCPAAFNTITGPKHWEMLARARAVDNQQFMLMCCSARDDTAGYVAYGHSLIVDPMGEVIAKLDEKEGVLDAELDFSRIAETRKLLPILRNTRHDTYQLNWTPSQEEEDDELR